MHEQSKHVRASPGARRVVMLTTVLGAACVAALPFVATRRALHPVAATGLAVIVLLFVASELLLIHLPVGRDTHTVSINERPLTLGLFLLPPVQLLLAAVIGSGIALGWHRRQRGVRLAFNMAQVGVQSALAVLIFAAAHGNASVVSVRSYLAAGAGILAAGTASAFLVTLAIRLFRGSSPGALTSWELVAGTAASVAKTALALLAISAVVHNDGFAVLLFVVCAGCMYYAFHSYGSLYQRHRRLEMLYRFTNAIGGSVEFSTITRAVVEEGRIVLRAARSELVIAGPDEVTRCRVGADDVFETEVLPALHRDDEFWARVVDGGETIITDDVLVTAVRGPSSVSGYLVVAERIGVDSHFDHVDLQLIQALARHAAVALENGNHVGQLANEMRDREYRATHDPLTGLVNRVHFTESLERALLSSETSHMLFVLGLDRFSEVNDILGHDNGDAVLRAVAERLRQATPPSATLARLDGDEFAVLWPASDAVAVSHIAHSLANALTSPITIDGLTLSPSVSVGLAIAPEHTTNGVALLRCGDTAMRLAKERRSRFEVHEPGRDGDLRRRMILAHQLREAIDSRQLMVFYQPKVHIATDHVLGVEALVRWAHPQLGDLPPDAFIPIAEHTGLIEPLTAFVLDTALRQRRAWAEAGLDLSVAVNISARSLIEPSFPERVMRALIRHRCPAEALTLEITETQMMADPGRTAEALHELHEIGVRVSIDDFGTGYSSLSSLRALPLDEVKIDKSFVIHAQDNENDASIVRSIANLGENLGLLVVAEGIEDDTTLAFIAACGVPVAQGYYLAQPLSPEAFTQWLRERIETRSRARS
jgi:diguanylate cyclase (GGDEF)-like protein